MTSIKTKKSLNRRDAIKVLAAAGAGLASATLLPGKWDKPAMQMGVLPAHAQSSKVTLYTIADSSETTYWTQQEDYFLALVVYINPQDSNVSMKATLWLDLDGTGYGSPQSVPSMDTVTGTATFTPFIIPFNWIKMKVTYEFVNAAQCTTGCSWTVEHTNFT